MKKTKELNEYLKYKEKHDRIMSIMVQKIKDHDNEDLKSLWFNRWKNLPYRYSKLDDFKFKLRSKLFDYGVSENCLTETSNQGTVPRPDPYRKGGFFGNMLKIRTTLTVSLEAYTLAEFRQYKVVLLKVKSEIPTEKTLQYESNEKNNTNSMVKVVYRLYEPVYGEWKIL